MMESNEVKQRSRMINISSTVLLIAVFAVAALVLMNVGLQVYKNVMLANNNNFELRTSLSYVATKIRQSDVSSRVYVTDIDGMQALVLAEEYDGEVYNTLIYHKDGALCELTQLEGYKPDIEFGFAAIEIDEFTIEAIGKEFIRLTAKNAAGEEERLMLSLRSEALE